MTLQIFGSPGKGVHDAHVEPLTVQLDHPSKVAPSVAVVEEHGQARHLCQLELAFKILDLGVFWTKEQAVVIWKVYFVVEETRLS